MDLDYDETAPGQDCGWPLCCRPENGATGTPAGHWGDAECGLPLWTFRDMLQQISAEHQVIK